MFFTLKLKNLLFYIIIFAFVIIGLWISYAKNPAEILERESAKAAALMEKSGNIVAPKVSPGDVIEKDDDFIKWVDFNVTASAMTDAMNIDIDTYKSEVHINWIDLLACLAARYGGDFKSYKKSDLEAVAERIKNGETAEEICSTQKYFSYYKEAYSAVLSEYLGEYSIIGKDGSKQTLYGLKAFSQIADGYYFSHYDDFGSSRSYGYARKHLGHDLMTSVGTPVTAVESGTIEALGWNQYGGWRIGVRSFDKKRYYYYAHLRKDHPYAYMLSEGSVVKAGDVIGYVGMTGYSAKENVNNINTPHLHFGIELIFDESQKDGNSEIWIDCYEITKFLLKNKSAVYRDDEKNEYFRSTEFFEESVENME